MSVTMIVLALVSLLTVSISIWVLVTNFYQKTLFRLMMEMGNPQAIAERKDPANQSLVNAVVEKYQRYSAIQIILSFVSVFSKLGILVYCLAAGVGDQLFGTVALAIWVIWYLVRFFRTKKVVTMFKEDVLQRRILLFSHDPVSIKLEWLTLVYPMYVLVAVLTMATKASV